MASGGRGMRAWRTPQNEGVCAGKRAQVYYKCTDLLDDQVLLSGTAAGALSEVPRQHWRSASLGALLAQEQGLYGLKPEVCWQALAASCMRGGRREALHLLRMTCS